MEFEPNEEIVHQFQVPDPEFGSYMAAELDKCDAIGNEISKLKYKVRAMEAQAHYLSATVWQQFWDKFPGNHPTDFKQNIDKMKFDTKSHTVYLTKMTQAPVDRLGKQD